MTLLLNGLICHLTVKLLWKIKKVYRSDIFARNWHFSDCLDNYFIRDLNAGVF